MVEVEVNGAYKHGKHEKGQPAGPLHISIRYSYGSITTTTMMMMTMMMMINNDSNNTIITIIIIIIMMIITTITITCTTIK